MSTFENDMKALTEAYQQVYTEGSEETLITALDKLKACLKEVMSSLPEDRDRRMVLYHLKDFIDGYNPDQGNTENAISKPLTGAQKFAGGFDV